MLSNNSTESQASTPSDTKAATAAASVALMDPRGTVDPASTGSGATNDPPGTDRPPCCGGDLDPLQYL
jgi:hypothetical protein